MSHTVTKFALGMMGRLRERPAIGDAAATIALPAPEARGGKLNFAGPTRSSRRSGTDA